MRNKCAFYTNKDILNAIHNIKLASGLANSYLNTATGKQDRTYANGAITDSVEDQNLRNLADTAYQHGMSAVTTATDNLGSIKDINQQFNNAWAGVKPDADSTTQQQAQQQTNNINIDDIKNNIMARVGKGLTMDQAKQAINELSAAIQTGDAIQPHLREFIANNTGIKLPEFNVGNSNAMLSGVGSSINTIQNANKTYNNLTNTANDLASGNYTGAASNAAATVNSAGKTLQGANKTLGAVGTVADNTALGNLANNAKEALNKIPGFKNVKAITDIAEIGAIIKDPSIKTFLEKAPSVADGLAQLGLKTAGPVAEIIGTYKAGQDLGKFIADTTGMTEAAQKEMNPAYNRAVQQLEHAPGNYTLADKARVGGQVFKDSIAAEGKALKDFSNNVAATVDNVTTPYSSDILRWYNATNGTKETRVTPAMRGAWIAAGQHPDTKKRVAEGNARLAAEKKEMTARVNDRYNKLKLQAQANPEWGLKNHVISQEEYNELKKRQMQMQQWAAQETARRNGGQLVPMRPNYYAQR